MYITLFMSTNDIDSCHLSLPGSSPPKQKRNSLLSYRVLDFHHLNTTHKTESENIKMASRQVWLNFHTICRFLSFVIDHKTLYEHQFLTFTNKSPTLDPIRVKIISSWWLRASEIKPLDTYLDCWSGMRRCTRLFFGGGGHQPVFKSWHRTLLAMNPRPRLGLFLASSFNFNKPASLYLPFTLVFFFLPCVYHTSTVSWVWVAAKWLLALGVSLPFSPILSFFFSIPEPRFLLLSIFSAYLAQLSLSFLTAGHSAFN